MSDEELSFAEENMMMMTTMPLMMARTQRNLRRQLPNNVMLAVRRQTKMSKYGDLGAF
jgi:hypothetical protein